MAQMAGLIHDATSLPVLKVGRIAGQFAKPRSQQEETRDEVTLPSFRGEIVNGADFSRQGRTLIRSVCSVPTTMLPPR